MAPRFPIRRCFIRLEAAIVHLKKSGGMFQARKRWIVMPSLRGLEGASRDRAAGKLVPRLRAAPIGEICALAPPFALSNL
jgi:hypothetical protein